MIKRCEFRPNFASEDPKFLRNNVEEFLFIANLEAAMEHKLLILDFSVCASAIIHGAEVGALSHSLFTVFPYIS